MKLIKKRILILFILFSGLNPLSSIAQQTVSRSAYIDSALSDPNALKVNCITDHVLYQLRKSPDYVAKEKKMNSEIVKRLLGGPDTVILTLPLVFHIINPNPSAITDAQIMNAVKDLNDAFGKTGAYAASPGADTRVRFGLAQKDPDGGITNGITRTTSFYSNNMNMAIEDARLKNLVLWDPAKYINIWLVTNIVGEISADFSCGVWTRSNAGGYATMPPGGSVLDGIVVTGFGALLAHEMGHYLSLYHTFEGGCTNNDCLTDGDRVCDTPPDGTTRPSGSCNSPGNSCNTDTLSSYSNGFFKKDTTDQISNFMDYGNAACSNQFTQGQTDRMRAAINTQRSGLLSDVLTKPCAENITALFSRDNADPKAGDPINFTNASTGAANYQWLVDGVQVSTVKDMSTTFFSTGKKKVTLKSFNSDATCFASYTDYILVNCGVTARFYNNKKIIASKTNILNDTILFTNNSVGATSYQWIISNDKGMARQVVTSNAPAPTANDLSYIFPVPANYKIKLIASNGGCVDSTEALDITVLDPTADAYVSIVNVFCYQETKIRVSFYACNFGYAPIAPNMPITFYDADPRLAGANKIGNTFLVPDSINGSCCGKIYTQILDIGYPRLNQLYAVVNDTGNTAPLKLPNTVLVEKNYTNNVAFTTGFRFTVLPVPSVVTLEPGDTLQLSAQTFPDPSASSTYLWSSAYNLSCSACRQPFLYADTTSQKRVIASSQYQCHDTAFLDIKVPPANDYTIAINNIFCAGKDSLTMDVTVSNLFKRGIIPKGLKISFYKDDPTTAGAVLLPPVFTVPDSISSKQKTYQYKIKKAFGNIYASVNDNGSAVPVTAASNTLPEKLYTNNFASVSFQPISKAISATVCKGDTVAGYTLSGTYIDTFQTSGGCDSVRTLNLTVKAAAITRTTVTAAICQGDNYAGHTTTGTYVDTYTGVNSCDSIRTLNLTVNTSIRQSKTVQVCKGGSYFAAGKLQTQSGIYIDSAKSFGGCDSIVTTTLVVNANPAGFLPGDTIVCIGRVLVLTLNGYNSVNWSTGTNANSVSITLAGTYSAQVVDRNGCQGGDTVNIAFDKCVAIEIPTAFTPNHDGKNDIFRPIIPAPLNGYRMQVWSRWGQLLFETHEYNKGWNGTFLGEIQPNGTYIYQITFTDADGFAVLKKGTLVLIR
jgi:gliding motility-associated-like protein